MLEKLRLQERIVKDIFLNMKDIVVLRIIDGSRWHEIYEAEHVNQAFNKIQ